MAIKLTTVNRFFIPDVEFPTDNGVTKNRALPPEDQVKCELSLATVGEKTEYIGMYSMGAKQFTQFQYEKCVRKHCKKITGLEDFAITNGKTLCDHEPTPELNAMVQEIFFKVNGIHADDSIGSDGGSELTEKE